MFDDSAVYLYSQIGVPWLTFKTYPFMIHSISMSMFASVIGPFGGFFASGFKRAFKIKVSSDVLTTNSHMSYLI